MALTILIKKRIDMQKFTSLSMIVCLFLCACNKPTEKEQSTDDITSKFTLEKEKTSVGISKVSFGDFDLEMISNGKAFAYNNAEIKFPISGKIKAIYIKNGDYVFKGQALAALGDTELKNKLFRCKASLNKALVELDDRLIDYGYRLKDSSKVPIEIMLMAKTKSGFNDAVYDYADAAGALAKTKIIAPFSGKVADMEAREFNNSDSFKKLCSLIDDSKMYVQFNVLESEFRFAGKGSLISITPYGANNSINGLVSQINPKIDANGMINILGAVNNPGGDLLDGMSVKVVMKKAIHGQMFIPKEAVLQRQSREIVFTYESGLAKWNYVKTEWQNTRYVTIKSGLHLGQKIIVTNNATLADNSLVTLDVSKVDNE